MSNLRLADKAPPSSGQTLKGLVALDQAILDALPMSVYVCAADGRVLRHNRKAEALWGRAPLPQDTRDGFFGGFKLFTSDGAPVAPDATPTARALLLGEGCDGAEVLVENFDGHRWMAAITSEPLRDEDDVVIGAVTCFQDITAHRRLKDETAHRDDFLTKVFNTTPECIKVVAPDGSLLRMNDAGLGMIQADDFASVECAAVLDLIAPEHRQAWKDNHERVCAGEPRVWTFDVIGLKGQRRHMETHATPIRLSDGRTAHLAVTRDISERHRQEAALADSERRLRQILESLPAAVYTTDAKGRLTFYNRAAVAFSGNEPELGADSWCVSWRLFWPDGTPLPHDECPMALAINERRPSLGEYEALAERPDGVRVPFVPYATPLFDGDGELTGAVNMLLDVTERKRAAETQQLLIDELNHRVKNTLATVQSVAMQTARGADSLEGFRDTFDDRLGALAKTHDLLTRSHWRGANLQDLLALELKPFGPTQVKLDGPAVELSAAAALSLGMVLHELMTNAAKYGALSVPEGSVAIRWRRLEGDALEIEWSEQGGPVVASPQKRGFGTRMLERNLTRDLGGAVEMDFRPTGLHCRLRVALDSAPST